MWKFDDSTAIAFDRVETSQAGILPHYAITNLGAFIAFTRDVRKLILIRGEPGGRHYMHATDECKNMVRDPTKPAATQVASYWLFVACRAPHVRFVQVTVELTNGAAYARATAAFRSTGSHHDVNGIDFHELWLKRSNEPVVDQDLGSGNGVKHIKWELDPSIVSSSINEKDDSGGMINGYIGTSPGASLVNATDAREIQLNSVEIGAYIQPTSVILGILPDPTVISSKQESNWLVVAQDGTITKCIRLAVTLREDGMAYLHVTGAFYDSRNQDSNHFSWVLKYAYETAPILRGSLFDAMDAHELWAKRDSTFPNALSAGAYGYGVRDVKWSINASAVSTFDRADKIQSGVLAGYVLASPGTPIAFVTDVRSIVLISGQPGGNLMFATDHCFNMTHDPTMPAPTKQASHWLFVSCGDYYVRFAKITVALIDGAAYAQVHTGFFSTGVYKTIAGMDFHDLFVRRNGNMQTSVDDSSYGHGVKHLKWRLDSSIVTSSVGEGDVPGYIGRAPGASLTDATNDARNIRLVSAEGGGSNARHGQPLGIVPDRSMISSLNESFYIFADRQSHWNRCVKLAVMRREDGMSYVQVNSAFRYHNSSWLRGDDAFDAAIAHEMWIKRHEDTYPVALSVDQGGYGIHSLQWEVNASTASAFDRTDTSQSGSVLGNVGTSPGSFVAFTTDVRKILLVSGSTVGRHYKHVTGCGEIVPDPAMPSATATEASWLFVTCDPSFTFFVQLKVEMRDGAAYVRWTGAFYRHGRFTSVEGMDLHDMWVRRKSTYSFAHSDSHAGISVRNVTWWLDPSIVGDDLAGTVTGYIGRAPGASLTDATSDARNIRLVSAEGGGSNARHGQPLGIVPDRSMISSLNESFYIFADRQSHWNRCVKLAVMRREDGMSYVQVNSAFRYHNSSWLRGDDAFDAAIAHEMWIKRHEDTYPVALSVDQGGYGIHSLQWEVNASTASAFDRTDTSQSGSVLGNVGTSPGSFVAFTTDVRKILLVSGSTVGRHYKHVTGCGEIVPDPAMPSATATEASWLFVTCDPSFTFFVQLKVEMRDGAAYVRWTGAFYRHGRFTSVEGMDLHDMWVRRTSTYSFAHSDSHAGISVRNVTWRFDHLIDSSSISHEEDKTSGIVVGYLPSTPGASLTSATDARSVRLVSAEPGGTGGLNEMVLGMVPDAAMISSRDQSYWIFAFRKISNGRHNRCVRIVVSLMEGMAHARVHGAFDYYNSSSSWVSSDSTFNAMTAHEMWTKKYRIMHNAVTIHASGYGLYNLTWTIDASGHAFDQQDKVQSGTIYEYIGPSGSAVAILTDARKLRLTAGDPGGRLINAAAKCKDIVPDTTMKDSKESSHWVFVVCDSPDTKLIKLTVTLRENVAYVRTSTAFWRRYESDTIDDVNVMFDWLHRGGTTSVTESATGSGYAVRNVRWSVDAGGDSHGESNTNNMAGLARRALLGKSDTFDADEEPPGLGAAPAEVAKEIKTFPKANPKVAIEDDDVIPGTITAWIRKDSDVLASGETILAFQATDVLERSASDGALVPGSSDSAAAAIVGMRSAGKLFFTALSADGTVACNVTAPAHESLTEGGWHFIAVVFETHSVSGSGQITFYVDGESTRTRCDLGADGSMFTFGRATMTPLRTVLVGAHYNAPDARFEGGLDARLDDLTMYSGVLNGVELKGLAVHLPCAHGFTGDGYVFFPDMEAVHGAETLRLHTRGRCAPILHTVSFRYLVSAANNK
jgi:hypothetical protein